MEWIKYHEAEKVFDLRTEHSTYQMQVREYDTLVHLYYGSPVGDALITDRIVCVDRGFSGNPYEAEKDRTFSLDTLPQEYTAYGNGDYRINGLETEQADGSDTANLKFESYEITKGKYSLKGLPAMFAKEDEAQTLEIVLTDRASGLKAHLLYGVFPHLDVITRAVRLENTGTVPVTVKKAMSVEMDYEYRELDAVHFYGRHNMERQMEIVYDTLQELEVGDKPVITLFNKCDMLDMTDSSAKPRDFKADKTVYISAKTGQGLDEFEEALGDILRGSKVYIEHCYGFADAGKIQVIRQYGQLMSEDYTADGIMVKGYIGKEYLDRAGLSSYLKKEDNEY